VALKFLRLTALISLVTYLTGCDNGHGMMTSTQGVPVRFQSNGERIYFTGASNSGQAITYTGGNVHLRMMGGSCATCHGPRRRGGRMMPQFWLYAPPLTREALFDSHEKAEGHGGHASYDAEGLRRAISRGIDPTGAPLDATMPRWSMSDEDWSDLVAYLRE
jgi:mono/diheme cytochrome c family protein